MHRWPNHVVRKWLYQRIGQYPSSSCIHGCYLTLGNNSRTDPVSLEHSFYIPNPAHTYSPKITISAVDITTACQPPPVTEWRIIGSVSLITTFDSSRVTKTQCLPRSKSARTFFAFFRSSGVPDSIKTWRLVSSKPIRPSVKPRANFFSNLAEIFFRAAHHAYLRIHHPATQALRRR